MKYVIGIDLGGTTIKSGLLTEDMEIVDKLEEPTHPHSGEEAITDHITAMVETLLQKNNVSREELAGVGVGTPGIVNSASGAVIYSNNFEWKDVPLKEILARKCGTLVAVDNDANCAVLGEAKKGAAKGCLNVLLLTLGTGVGSGILVNGSVPNGTGSGGVAGHMIIKKGGRPCTCGKKGCLEAYTSATALVSRAKEAFQEVGTLPEKALDEMSGKLFFDLVKANDPTAVRLLEEYADDLAVGLSSLIDIFRPEKVLIGGGLSGAGEVLLNPLREKTKALCFAGAYLSPPEITAAGLKNDAGIIGAASLLGKVSAAGKWPTTN